MRCVLPGYHHNDWHDTQGSSRHHDGHYVAHDHFRIYEYFHNDFGIADARFSTDACSTANTGMRQLGIDCEQRLQRPCGMGIQRWNISRLGRGRVWAHVGGDGHRIQ